MKHLVLFLAVPLLIATSSCRKLAPPAPAPEELLDGPVDGLSPSQSALFLAGDAAFNDEVFHAGNGLGPYFVSTSCGSCHAGDGKGHPAMALVRFGQHDTTGNHYLHAGGPQLQHRALPGYLPEVLPAGVPHATFLPPANTGLGFIENVPEADILMRADPFDADGDGISGVPHWNVLPPFITPHPQSVPLGNRYLCRIGKKGAVYNLFQQTVTAYNQDMGITSSFLPDNPINPLDGTLPVPSSGPEVSDEVINAVVFYLQTLKVPPRRNADDPVVRQGEALFHQIGCEACHRSTFRTGPSSVAALSYREFHPFSDLLLHDMGPGLDDGYTEGNALAPEWRTAPLWGLGLAAASQGGRLFLLHDGRARSIDEAIRQHGGEAAGSRDRYLILDGTDRDALIRFLESL